jgi:hypothetical protein
MIQEVFLAERVGFEPTTLLAQRCSLATAAFNRSATSPQRPGRPNQQTTRQRIAGAMVHGDPFPPLRRELFRCATLPSREILHMRLIRKFFVTGNFVISGRSAAASRWRPIAGQPPFPDIRPTPDWPVTRK